MTVIDINDVSELELLAEGGVFDSGCVAALGLFDGMHKAHRILLARAKAHSEALALPLAVLTFFADDGEIKSTQERIHTDKERLELLDSLCVNITVRCRFSAIKALEAEDFVNDVLCDRMHARVAVAGYNYRFGRGGDAGVYALRGYLSKKGASLDVIDGITEGGESISSSKIRELLREGKVEDAAHMSGMPYFISGKVSHGLGLGTGMGIPTVNTDLDRGKVSLPHGVYLSCIELDGSLLPSLTNIGSCPTFGERASHAETFILDFCKNLYGEAVRIYFLKFIRKERTFESKDALLEQIKKDTELAQALFKEIKWQEIGLSLQ